MKKILPLLAFSLFACFANAQSKRATVQFRAEDFRESMPDLTKPFTFKFSRSLPVPLVEPEPFIAYSITWESINWNEKSAFLIKFKNGDHKPAPIRISPDTHAETAAGKYVSQLYFTEKEMKKFSISHDGGTDMQNIVVHFFSPGATSHQAPVTSHQAPVNRNVCPCEQPDYQGRLDWCPDGTCPTDPTPETTTVTHLIVHHSAGSNTSSDWAATVRSIWDFHVNVNGWDDIGYNWLVDPNGVLYEGRGDNRVGAHFCGQNGGTMGTCVLGDFTSITPTDDAYSTLEGLLAWKICDIGAPHPSGSGFHPSSGLVLPFISGHRDGCNTACPGNAFYPTLDLVREQVQACAEVFSALPERPSTGLGRVQISPNPANEMATLTIDNQWVGAITAALFDAAGRQVKPETNLEKKEETLTLPVDLSGLPSGVFFIKITQSDGAAGLFEVVKN